MLPPLNAQITVDWTPDYCTTYEPAEQLPRWSFFVVAGIAGTLTVRYLYGRAIRNGS